MESTQAKGAGWQASKHGLALGPGECNVLSKRVSAGLRLVPRVLQSITVLGDVVAARCHPGPSAVNNRFNTCFNRRQDSFGTSPTQWNRARR